MDVVGSEIGQKMRSAIKAKLTELGCYVDDELPDYVMVMVANKRTRAQMDDDLQLFLGDNTELFVNWLHQVLKKLQEVTVTAPIKAAERDKSKERSLSKDRKPKEKKNKDKVKKTDLKKAKKKEKEKIHKKKEEKKAHKSKKKSKHHEMIRPNVPPLLMNIEKESEPSITDVFAGQILKNHGISLEDMKEDTLVDKKPVIAEKRPILPIIDPATISSQPDLEPETEENNARSSVSSIPSISGPRDEQLKEINEIETKIQGLKQKLAEQLDSMSEDEDFLNIRTEAEELMNDFAEDVFQEISQQAPVSTPPIQPSKSPSPIQTIPKPIEIPEEPPIETLPQIELKLPKRPVRERLGVREEPKKVTEVKEKDAEKRIESPERFTPERDPDVRPQKQPKTRIEGPSSREKKHSLSDDGSDRAEHSSKRLTSRVSVLESRPSRATCASVVRVRPRPRVATTTSNLLMKAVADAHKSLLNIPPKSNPELQQVKRALVLPMRRTIDPQKIVIEVPASDMQDDDNDPHGDSISLHGDSDCDKIVGIGETEKEECRPLNFSKNITNSGYVLSRRAEARTTSKRDDTLIIETLNIHNPTVGKDKNTQFIVTMDGFNPNAFLAKKLQSEGILNDEESIEKSTKKDIEKKVHKTKEKEIDLKEKEDLTILKEKETPLFQEKVNEISKEDDREQKSKGLITSSIQTKRLSNTSDESDTQVIIKKEEERDTEKRNTTEIQEESPPLKKRKASPIVFDVSKKERVERARTESASSDNQVVVTTTINTHKYDTVPPLSQAERKIVWCRAFPLCRYGSSCAFLHPRCKFAAACTRRNCLYSHAPNAVSPVTPSPAVASHVVPVANYKSISGSTAANMCKYYPNCVNPTCHFYHPKPCRFGMMCTNKLECNFYHADVPAKWRYTL